MNSNISAKISEEERDVEKDFGGKKHHPAAQRKMFFLKKKKSIFHKIQLYIEGENDKLGK